MIYIGGSLFTEAEIAQRKKEDKLLKSELSKWFLDYEELVFNPIEQPFNDKNTLPCSYEIARGDWLAMQDSTHLIFNLDNVLDTGVFLELGEMLSTDKQIYCVISDMRFENAGEYDRYNVPVGFNQYVIGRLEMEGINVYQNFESCVKDVVKDYVKEHQGR